MGNFYGVYGILAAFGGGNRKVWFLFLHTREYLGTYFRGALKGDKTLGDGKILWRLLDARRLRRRESQILIFLFCTQEST